MEGQKIQKNRLIYYKTFADTGYGNFMVKSKIIINY